MTPEQAKAYYKDKEFYEKVYSDGDTVLLKKVPEIRLATQIDENQTTAYVQVIDGQVVRFFNKNEIVEIVS